MVCVDASRLNADGRGMFRPLLTSLLFIAFIVRAEPVRVVAIADPPAKQPQLAIAPDGGFHVVFGGGNAIFHTASRDGRTFSMPVKIGELEKLALGMRRGPRITATEKVLAVTAISHADGMLHEWISSDGGATWKTQTPLNESPSSAREGLHAMAGNGRGLVAVAWLDLRNKGTEIWSRVSRDGGLTWQRETRVYASPDGHVCECCHPSVAIGPHDEIGVMWRNWLGGSRDLWMATSTDGGATFRDAEKMGDGTWKLNGCPMDGGALAFSANGKPLTIGRREKTIFFAESAGRETVLTRNGSQPVLAGTSLLWEENGGLTLKRETGLATRFAESAAFAATALTADGTPVIVWESRDSPGTIFLEKLLPSR